MFSGHVALKHLDKKSERRLWRRRVRKIFPAPLGGSSRSREGAETFRRAEEDQRVVIAGGREGEAGINGEMDSSAPGKGGSDTLQRRRRRAGFTSW